ncbi:hypothetical protein MNBD_DELTA04-1245 [hydrothermal vent metagenome]|uniref:HPr domain-containing protein n=1 Tax=hydrothermal vent metagenome TaxID=652676 RepID=A0A3B0VC36_9ZZZZ
MKPLEKELTVNNPNGVHGRVASHLARIAGTYDATVHIVYEKTAIDCTAILDVLSMGLVYGTRLKIRIGGRERKKAMAEVEKLFFRRDDP